jgi:hypothetical protein
VWVRGCEGTGDFRYAACGKRPGMEIAAAGGEEDKGLVGGGLWGLGVGRVGLPQRRAECSSVEWCKLHMEGGQEWVRVRRMRGDVVDVDC